MTYTVDGQDSFYLIDGDTLIGEVSCSRNQLSFGGALTLD
jgi:hypothetical protein